MPAKGNVSNMLTDRIIPAALTKTSRRARGTDTEQIMFVQDRHTRWLAAEQSARDRMFEAMRAVLDLNGESWPDEAREDLLNQGRHITSINILQQKLATLAGSIQSEQWDYQFTPLDMEYSTLTQGIKHWYYADKDQFNYRTTENLVLMDGLRHAGCEEMVIDYSLRKTGAISFIHNIPGNVLKDPYWQTNDLRDWREALKQAYMTVDEIADKWDVDDAELRAEQKRLSQWYTYPKTDDLAIYKSGPTNWGSKELVLEYRWLEKYRTTRLYAHMPDASVIPLPINVEESEVRDFIAAAGISWADIEELPYEDDILYYSVCAPNLLKRPLIKCRKHPVQCGMIGYLRFSFFRMMGIEKGAAEYALDIQRTFNYRESKKDQIIANSAAGALLADKNRMGGASGVRRFQQNKTHPGYVHPVDGSPSNILGEVPTKDVPESIFRDMGSLIDLFDRVLPVTPALEGAATRDESGILFRMRHAATKLGSLILYENWQQYLADKAEMWYNQAQITYKGLYRKIKKIDAAGFVEFNVPTYRNGQRVYLNSVESLPRAQVVIHLKKSSPTEQIDKRLQLSDMDKILAGHGDMFIPQTRTVIQQLMNTLDMAPEDKQYYEMLFEIQKQGDLAAEIQKLTTAQAGTVQAEMMKQQGIRMLEQMSQQAMQRLGSQPEAPEAVMAADRFQRSPGGPPPETELTETPTPPQVTPQEAYT